MHEVIHEKLKEAARAKPERLLYYSDIAPLSGLDMAFQEDRNKMAEILGDISTYEHDRGRPLLSAVVVHRGDPQLPGDGFFKLAMSLKLIRPGQDRAMFWAEELKKVYEYWQHH